MTLDMIKKVICLESVVDNILKSASSKYGVETVCKKYKQLLSEGRPEELLYKSFLNEMSVYNSISSVNTELLLLEKRINDNKNDIDVITLLHEMYDSGDYSLPAEMNSLYEKYLKLSDLPRPQLQPQST